MKRWTLVSAIVLAASSTVVLGQSTPPQALEARFQPSLDGATAYVYKRVAGTDLRLWVFSPSGLKAGDARAAIVFFGGGGWVNQNPAQFSPQARELAARGMVAVVADYRVLSANNATPYDAVADAKSAVRWLREHAAELHIVPTSLAAGGGSAGGHLALATALLTDFDDPGENLTVSSKPNALVLFNPVPNTVLDPQSDSPQRQRAAAMLGPRAREISPLHHLEKNLPPTIIFHGKADQTVPFGEVEAFCTKATNLGNRCELVGFDGASHGFFNPGTSTKWYTETLERAEQFLASLGYIK